MGESDTIQFHRGRKRHNIIIMGLKQSNTTDQGREAIQHNSPEERNNTTQLIRGEKTTTTQ